MGSWGLEDSRCLGGTKTGGVWDEWGQAVRTLADHVAPHSHTDKPDEQQGEKQTTQPRAPAQRNKASNL